MVMRPLVVLMILLSLAFFGFGLVSKALGSLQPPHPALAGFIVGCEDKPQPCWYGIVPGVTEYAQARIMIESAGFQIPPHSGSFDGYGCRGVLIPIVDLATEKIVGIGAIDIECEDVTLFHGTVSISISTRFR